MKITILTLGTRGDVQPYVALGKELIKKQHDVTISTGETFESFIESNGLNFVKADADMMALLKTEEGKVAFNSPANLIKSMKFFKEKIIPSYKQSMIDFLEASRNADLIIYHPKALGATDISEYLNIPCICISLVPMVYPISEFPNLAISPSKNFGSKINKWTYKLTPLGMMTFIKIINEFRVNILKLNKRKATDSFLTIKGKNIPIVYPISSYLVKDVKSWNERVLVPGFYFLDIENETLCEDLKEFINKGSKPIIISFSSMPLKNPSKFKKIIVKALKKVGERGIVITGSSGLDFGCNDQNLYFIEKVAHRLVFEQAKGIVHHGGVGTTAEALLSGQPQLIMPFNVDQPFWANKLYKLGLALKPIKEKDATIENLADAFKLMNDESTIKRAKEFKNILEHENGISKTIKYIESIVD